MTGLAGARPRIDQLTTASEQIDTDGVRVMGAKDLNSVRALLAQRPVHNLFVASRIASLGIAAETLGCPILGYERAGQLQGVCHCGTNVTPVMNDPFAVEVFADHLVHRQAHSIAGEVAPVMGLWNSLRQRTGSGWEKPRDVRPRQPLMMIDSDPVIAPHPEVRLADLSIMQPYFAAAVAMYTEEVGIDPTIPSPHSYRNHVRGLINRRHAFAVVRDLQVIFKADIGPAADRRCQIQGVWLDPRFRGAGLAPAMVAAVVRLARQRYETVSLYVNDYNHAAIATYRRVGFTTIGELATVLY